MILDKKIKISHILRLVIMALFLTSCSAKPNLGLVNNQLTPCPKSPNCVNSFSARDDKSYVEPILYKTDNTDILEKIILNINSMPRTKLLVKTNNYLHYEFRTLLGFVDDVEFYVNAQNQIHFRSASRLGYYDFNVNYNRYLAIKEKLNL
jgi:uncharacterized protein (DUF1499 family)